MVGITEPFEIGGDKLDATSWNHFALMGLHQVGLSIADYFKRWPEMLGNQEVTIPILHHTLIGDDVLFSLDLSMLLHRSTSIFQQKFVELLFTPLSVMCHRAQ